MNTHTCACMHLASSASPSPLSCVTAMDQLTRPTRTTGCSFRASSRSCQWFSQTSTSTWEGTRSASAAGEPPILAERRWGREGRGGEGRGGKCGEFAFHLCLLQVHQSCHLEVDGRTQHHWTVRPTGAVLRHTVSACSELAVAEQILSPVAPSEAPTMCMCVVCSL